MSKRKSKQRQIKKHDARVVHLWGHDMFNPPIAKITALRELTREELPFAVLEKAPMATGAIEITCEVRFFEVDDWPPIYAPDGTKIVY